MIEKSESAPVFYRVVEALADGAERVESLPTSAGPWSPEAQHGGPPAALLGRAVERLPESEGRVIGRITVELHGPVPVGPLRVSARVVRPGRAVCLVAAELVDETSGRTAATAAAWLLPRDTQREAPGPAPEHGPNDGVEMTPPGSWHRGYLDAVSWRWVGGAVASPGPAVVWMHTPGIVEGEEPTGVQRLLACADSASGVSAVLDPLTHGFLNTELTVHFLREPRGEWMCVDAVTVLGDGAVGLATSTISDARGPVARSAQTLLLQPR